MSALPNTYTIQQSNSHYTKLENAFTQIKLVYENQFSKNNVLQINVLQV